MKHESGRFCYDQSQTAAPASRVGEPGLSRPLNDLDLLVLLIDGVVISDHTIVEALGIDSEGCKHILGLWGAATENATVCKALLEDLVERGLPKDRPMLVVIDD